MKKSVENQIKNAFDKVDEQNSALDFDKAALWKSIKKKEKRSIIPLYWYNVASVAAIILLSVALTYSLKSQKTIEQTKTPLAATLQSTPIEIETIRDTIYETKIVYKTKIKEVESSEMISHLASLNKKYQELEKQYQLLDLEASQIIQSKLELSANLKLQEENWEKQKTAYTQEINELKSSTPSSGFSIDIDQEALLALSKEEKKTVSTDENKQKQSKINIEYNSKVLESTAPIFKGFSFN